MVTAPQDTPPVVAERGLGPALWPLLVLPLVPVAAIVVAVLQPGSAWWAGLVAALVVGVLYARQAARFAALWERFQNTVSSLELDPETRLPGTRALAAELDVAVSASVARGTPVSVVMVSVDDLRPLLVDRGHEAGVRLWRQVGASLSGVAAVEGGRAFRLHGQAVVAVVPDASLAKAERVAQRLAPALALASRRNGGLVRLSVGTAVALAGDLPEDVLRRAEEECARRRSGRYEPPVPRLRAVPPVP